MSKSNCFFAALFLITPLMTPILAQAAGETDPVSVDAIKKKYWARGDESELGVVQNRLYTKESRVELSVFGGSISSDPFLDVHSLGASLGYHPSEYVGLRLLAWKAYSGPSSALQTFEAVSHATTNTNQPKAYYGGEIEGSLLYGKLSLLGKKIIYYDFHVLGGLGMTDTESGTFFTPSIGLGQQVWLSHSLSLLIDYRYMTYHEDILEKVRPSTMGQVVDQRTNKSNVISIGVSFLFGSGGEQ